MTTKYIDYLTEDEPISGQGFVCLSFLSPEGVKNCTVRGLKVRGVYSTYEEAKRRSNEIRDSDPDFHVFVGEVGKWLPWDPDPNDIDDQNYKEKELNNLMKAYKDNLSKAKKVHNERIDDMKMQAKQQQQQHQQQNKTRDRLVKKLEQRKQKTQTEKEIQSKELEIKQRDQILETKKKEMSSLNNIDAKLERIKKLYESSNQKPKIDIKTEEV